MKNATTRLLGLVLAVLASAALAGCYAQIEDSTVSLTHELCAPNTPNCLPGNGIPLDQVDLVPPFNINLGDSGLLSHSETREGPVTFKTNLALNQVVLTMKSTGSLSAITLLQLKAVLNGDNDCVTPSNCQIIAGFDAATDGPADQTLVLKSAGVNLLDVTHGSQTLSLVLKATGKTPDPITWDASVEFGLSLKARASYP